MSIWVDSDMTHQLDDVASALASAGISGAIFSGVNTFTNYNVGRGEQPQPALEWSFVLTRPLKSLPGALAQPSAAQQAFQRKPGPTLSFSISGLQVSPQAQPACVEADLVSDAIAQAQKVAAAAGVSVGSITAISDSRSGSSVAYSAIFDPAVPFGLATFLNPSPASATCSISVSFPLS